MNIHDVKPSPELLERATAERPEYPSAEVRPFVRELYERGRVTAEEWAVPMNGYERELLVPVLELEVFVQMVEHCVANCGRMVGSSYDAALVGRWVPEALRRLRELAWASSS